MTNTKKSWKSTDCPQTFIRKLNIITDFFFSVKMIQSCDNLAQHMPSREETDLKNLYQTVNGKRNVWYKKYRARSKKHFYRESGLLVKRLIFKAD